MTAESFDHHAAFAAATRLQKEGQLAEAAAGYEAVLRAIPDHFDALFLSGVLALQVGDLPKGIARLQQATALNPTFPKAHLVLASALLARNDFGDALAAYDRALSLTPDDVKAHSERASILMRMKRLDEALAAYDHALTLAPDNADFQVDRAFCLIAMGRWQEGYAAYEWRKKQKQPLGVITAQQPAWDGAAKIAGKTLFLYSEQGLGDTIQHARFAPFAESLGARVVLSVQAQLVALLRSLSPTIDVRPTTEYVDNFDLHASLMSLPMAFRATPETVPAHVPYLHAPPDRVSRWRERIGASGFKIAIVWQGSPAKIDVGRSFPLALFNEMARLPGVRLISLQKNNGAEQIAAVDFPIETLTGLDEGDQAFLDTSAVMMNVDLVITSDTAVAHLAGALGRPTWVALKYVPDSRWGVEGTTTPWYPTARLFRQSAPGDWAGVFRDMAKALKGQLTS